MNVQERFQHAADLVNSGEYPEATSELLWLWNHMLDEDKSYFGVRSSYLATWMKRLAELDERARNEFMSMRDKLVQDITVENPDFQLFMDWLTLCERVPDDNESIERWVDRRMSDGGGPLALRPVRVPILSWLQTNGRWADAGKLLEPGSVAVAKVRLEIEQDRHNDTFDDELKYAIMSGLFERLLFMHISYLAADREDEAWLIVDVLLESWEADESRSAICRAVIDAEVSSSRHADLAQRIDNQSLRTEISKLFPDSSFE